MDPEKRKRIRAEHQRWLENDPTNRRLRERIEYHRARAEKQRQKRSKESGDRGE